MVRRELRGETMGLIRGDIRTEDFEKGVILPMLVEEVRGRKSFQGKGEEELFEGVHNRVCRFFFATVDTTTMKFAHVLYDVIGYPKDLYVQAMRKEVRDTYQKFGGVWSRESLGELKSLDAFVRESQRLHPLGNILGSRKVARREGLNFVCKGEGEERVIHIPYGERLEAMPWPVHMDEEFYEEPEVFKGFKTRDESVAVSNPSGRFMSFGFGEFCSPFSVLSLEYFIRFG